MKPYAYESELLDRAINAMAALHRSIEPMEDDPDLAGKVPPRALREFVDALAEIDRERCQMRRSGNSGEHLG